MMDLGKTEVERSETLALALWVLGKKGLPGQTLLETENRRESKRSCFFLWTVLAPLFNRQLCMKSGFLTFPLYCHC